MNEFKLTMERAKHIEEAIQHFEWFLDDLKAINGLSISRIEISTSSDNSLKDMREYLHSELSRVMEEKGLFTDVK